MGSYSMIDKDAVEALPGCAFWIDNTGRIFLGVTENGAAMTMESNAQKITCDEGGNTPLKFLTGGDSARIELTMLETTFARMARVCPNMTLDGSILKFGAVPGQTMPTGTVFHRPFAYPDGSRDLILKNACNIADQNLMHKFDEPMKLTCSFEGVLDETADDGDLLTGGLGYR